jgi:hypothetical protein
MVTTAIPEELQRLWSERDRKRQPQQPEAELPVITLEDSDEPSGATVILDSLDDPEPSDTFSVSPLTPAVPLTERIVCFPTHSIQSDINLAKYESDYERQQQHTSLSSRRSR